MLQRLQIKQHYTPLNKHLKVDDPVWMAWRMMKDCGTNILPVLKRDKVVGVITDKDIVQISGYNGGQSMPVKEAMSLDPLVLFIDEPMDKALKAMLKKDQQHAVVINRDNEIVGLFSWTSAFKFFLTVADMATLKQQLSS